MSLNNISSILYLFNSSVLNSLTTGDVGYGWPNYLALALGSVGIATNLINILVFVNPLLKDPTFRYMLAKSVIILFYFIFLVLNVVLVYCGFCPVTFTYAANVYSIAVGYYLFSSLNIMRLFIEITISLRTYTILNNRMYCTRVSYVFIIGVIVLLGLVYYVQKPFTFRIVYVSQLGVYYVVSSDFGLTRIAQTLSIAQEMIRVLLIVILLTVINVLNLVKFRRRFKQRKIGAVSGLSKQQLANPTSIGSVAVAAKSMITTNQQSQVEQNVERNNEATRSLTKMVLVTSFFRILCELPFVAAFVLIATGRTNEAVFSFFYASAAAIYVPPMCDICIYYFFNKNFKTVLNRYIRVILGLRTK